MNVIEAGNYSCASLEERFAEATALARCGSHEKALQLFRQLLVEFPDEYTLRNNCAYLLEKLGSYDAAETEYRILFEEMPGYANGALGYARMLANSKKYGAAILALRRALVVSPEDSRLLGGLANALVMAGDAEAALLWYGAALERSQQDKATLSNFLYTLLMVAEISPLVVARELELLAGSSILSVRLARAAAQLGCLDSDFIASMHRYYGGLYGARNRLPVLPDREGKRIRVGYVSADLYAHPVGYFLQGLLACHDKNRFEVFVFSPFAERDGLTAELKRSAEHWIVLHVDNRSGLLEQIREYQLDIVVDMAGHTGGNYLDLFAQGLAPLQITWGGYPGTTGLTAMDYIVADRVGLPAKSALYYSEAPLWLPRDYVCFVPPVDAPLLGPLPAAMNGVITFGSFNTVQKLNSTTLSLWCSLLHAVPGSRLFLKSKGFDDPLVCVAFLKKLAKEGVAPERVILEGFSPRSELLAAYQQVDIALDPVPYQGGITVLEALWMGVPTLVFQSQRQPFIRHAESHLYHVGLSDWIADSEDDYRAKAMAFSKDLAGLAVLRSRLRQQVALSPVCDIIGFTHDLEVALEQIILKF